METFIILRNLTFFFATIMLAKYYIFLILAPFYPVKESFRRLRIAKMRHNSTKSKTCQPKISVIIPARNEEVGITRSIESLLNNTYPLIEIIVVNDGSTDRTEAVVRDYLKKVNEKGIRPGITFKYILGAGGGKGAALNSGVQQVTGKIIATMDADSVFDKNALTNLAVYFSDPSIDAVVGNVRISTNKTLVGHLQLLEYLFGFYFKRAHAVMDAEYVFGGACSAFRRDIFTKLGLFSTTNKTEDIEMSMRARYNGLQCAFAEDVLCFTEGASTVIGLINQRLRWKKGRLDTFVKYRSLFFSTEKRHNKFLSWFVLPYALMSELQLLFEPVAITLLLTYSVVSGDYLSLAFGSLFIFVIYLVNAIFSYHRFNLMLLIHFFFTWPLFYLIVWIEYLALLKGGLMFIRGREVVWQQWHRQGVRLIETEAHA